MKSFRMTLGNYARLARLSNLPTVVANVLAGCAIGAAETGFPWQTAVVMSLSMMCFYAAGMALNDLADLQFDLVTRPERPIPSGRISVRAAHAFAINLLLFGIMLAATQSARASVAAFVLGVAILAYNMSHKLFAWSVVLMGLCRALVYVTTVLALRKLLLSDLVYPFTVAAYTALITLVAREENTHGRLRRVLRNIAAAMPLFAPVALILGQLRFGAQLHSWQVIACLAVITAIGFASRPALTGGAVKKSIVGWIVSMALLDALFVCGLGYPLPAVAALACFGLAAIAQRRILGT